jgi:hypothetical protein
LFFEELKPNLVKNPSLPQPDRPMFLPNTQKWWLNWQVPSPDFTLKIKKGGGCSPPPFNLKEDT